MTFDMRTPTAQAAEIRAADNFITAAGRLLKVG
jgi:hypothetical protein